MAGGGTVRGFVVKNADYSRTQVDGIVDQAKQLGAAGLIWARTASDGTLTSSIMKALGEDVRQMLAAAGAAPGDLLLVAAGEPDATSKLLGQLRLSLARRRDYSIERYSSGSWTFRSSSGMRTRGGICRCTTRSRRRTTMTLTGWTPSRARFEQRHTTSC